MKNRNIDKLSLFGSMFLGVMSAVLFGTAFHSEYWTDYFIKMAGYSVGMMRDADVLIGRVGYVWVAVPCAVLCLGAFLYIIFVEGIYKNVSLNTKPQV